MQKLKGFVALLSCAVIFGSMSIFIRILSRELTVFQQISFRNLVALLISLGVIFLTKQSFRSVKNVSLQHMLLYMFTFPLGVVLFTFSVLQTKVVTTVFGLYLGSLLTSLIFGMVFFREKLTPMKLLSLLLVTVGLISYVYPFQVSVLDKGFLLALMAGFFDATANSFRKYLSGKVDRFVLVALQMVGGLIIAVSLLVAFGPLTIPTLSLPTWIAGLIFGFEVAAISYLTLVGFQNFDLNLGTVVLSTELFWGSLFALVVFGEVSTFTEMLGGALIVVASVVANMATPQLTWWQKRLAVVLNKAKLSRG